MNHKLDGWGPCREGFEMRRCSEFFLSISHLASLQKCSGPPPMLQAESMS